MLRFYVCFKKTFSFRQNNYQKIWRLQIYFLHLQRKFLVKENAYEKQFERKLEKVLNLSTKHILQIEVCTYLYIFMHNKHLNT